MTTVADRTPAPPPRRGLGVVAIAAGTVAAYVAVMLVGRAEDAAGARILGVFDPVFLWLRGPGASATDWLDRHPLPVALALAIGLALLAAWALLRAGRHAAPLLAACATLALGIGGQALLLGDATALGRGLYLAGIAAAFALGWWRPMRQLPGFPATGVDAGAGLGGAWRPAWRVEWALILGLTGIGLLCRTWALTELSDFLDLETVDSWLQSRTLHGTADYVRFVFLATNPGAAHMLPQWALFNVFGTSLFTLRMAAVAWGVLSVPLMYWFVRRLAGPAPAVLAALLMATAPDQLFWSRSENGFFAPVPVLALLTVHVALSMSTRLSATSVAAAALLMPASRYAYTTCLAMVLIPLAVAGHAGLFLRGAWRRFWYVLPLLALGLVAWWFHLTVLLGVLGDGPWRFRHPAQIYGGTAWTKQGDFAEASIPELIRLQAESFSTHLVRVVRDLTDEQRNSFGHWYMRAQPNPHPTTMNVGVVVLLALGVGYLGGQLRDPRAWLLLTWLLVALLPGIGSRDAAPRRMLMLFPVAHVVGSLFVAAVIRIARQVGGRRLAACAAAAASAALLTVVVTNTVSHFRMPLQPMIFSDHLRFLRPIVERSDTVFVNLPGPFHSLLIFDSADRFVTGSLCSERVRDAARWLPLALRPRCTFADPVAGLAFTAAEREAADAAHTTQRVSFIFFVDPTTQAELDIVRGLYPQAQWAEYTSPRDQRHSVALSIDIADSAALHAPRLRTAMTPPPQILADVEMRASSDGAPPDRSALIEGGILVDRDGWYRFDLQPGCSGAELHVGTPPVGPPAATALLAGVQPFTLRLPDATACPLPQRLTIASAEAPDPIPLDPDRITSREVTALPIAAAPPLRGDAGYDARELIRQLPGRSADLAIAPDGSLLILIKGAGGWRLHRYAADGHLRSDWALDAPPELDPSTMAVAPDGTVAILFGQHLLLVGPEGQALGRWNNLAFVWESRLAFAGPDRLVVTIPHRNAVAVFGRDGAPLGEYTTFPAGPPVLFAPSEMALTADGDLALLQPDRLALRFETPSDRFAPVFQNAFSVAAAASGLAFDGRDRLLVLAEGRLLVYDMDGTRLMADTPARDPSRLRLGPAARVRSSGGRLYVLDPEGSRVWQLQR